MEFIGVRTVAANEFRSGYKLSNVSAKFSGNHSNVDDYDKNTNGVEDGRHDTCVAQRNENGSKENTKVHEEIDQP